MTTEEFFDVDPDDLHKGGFDIVAPGYYVAFVVGVADGKSDNYVFDFRICCANKGREREVGKTHREWIAKNSKEGNRKKRAALAIALGLTTADAMKEAAAAGKPLAIDWYQSPLGRPLCFDIEVEEPKEGGDEKPRNKVPFWHYYHIDSKDARRFPVDHKAIEAARVKWEQEECDPWDKERKEAGSAAASASSVASGKEEVPFDPFA